MTRAAAGATLLLLAALHAGAGEAPRGWHTWPPGYTSPSGALDVALAGYAQLDLRAFHDWDVAGGDAGRGDEAELRRARLGFEGRYERLEAEVKADLADSDEHLKDAWAGWRFSKALRLRAGRFKPPVSREFLTSAARLDFVERSLLGDSLGPRRDWGAMLHGRLGRRIGYEAGVFAGDGATRVSRAGTTLAARVLLSPAKGLDLGGSASFGDVEADAPGVDDPQPRGVAGDSPSGYRFFARKFVDGRRRRLGLEAAYARGPVGLTAEWLELRDERRGQGATFDDLPDLRGRGFSVAATWLVTGEKKKARLEPRRALFDGPGAVELGLRYEGLRFDDSGPDAGFAGAGSRARNIRPQADRALTGGVSWWPAAFMRLEGNVVVERYDDALLAPEPGRRGDYVTLVARLQLMLP